SEDGGVRRLVGCVLWIEGQNRSFDIAAFDHAVDRYGNVQIVRRWLLRFLDEALLRHVHPADKNEVRCSDEIGEPKVGRTGGWGRIGGSGHRHGQGGEEPDDPSSGLGGALTGFASVIPAKSPD